MKPRILETYLILFLWSVLASGSNTSIRGDQSWNSKMQEMQNALSSLLADASSGEVFFSPKSSSRIESSILKIAKNAGSLTDAQKTLADQDPSIAWVSGQLATEANRAARVFRFGNKSFARDLVLGLNNYCIACHTRNGSGISIADPKSQKNIEKLGPMVLADYFVSTRAFLPAVDNYLKVIENSEVSLKNPFTWERAVFSVLALSVRVQNDPDLAAKIVEKSLASSNISPYFRTAALSWKSAIQSWKAEPKSKPQTEEGLYATLVKRVADAQTKQKYPADKAVLIDWLRAQASSHDLLNLGNKSPHLAQTLFLAGICEDGLRDFRIPSSSSFYYLGCIVGAPHSKQAEECLDRYEQGVYEGYTGSRGEDVPIEEIKKLQALRKLAQVKEVPIGTQ